MRLLRPLYCFFYYEKWGIFLKTLTKEEEILRDLYLRDLASGKVSGSLTGKASVDKPWLKSYPEEAITDELKNQTIYEYLKSSISDEPNRVLVNYFGREITAGEILENIDRTAEYFSKIGVLAHDKVALALPGLPEAIYCIYGLNKLGAVAVNIDPRLNVEDLKRDIEASRSKFFVGIDSTSSKIKIVRGQYPLTDVMILSALRSAPSNSLKMRLVKGLSKMMEIKDGNFVFNRVHKYGKIHNSNFVDSIAYQNVEDTPDLAVIVHTGGTTGIHKGVKVSNHALNRTVHDHNYIVDDVVEVGDSIYNPLPPFMSYGMTTLHLALCKKLYMYMVPAVSLDKFGDEIARLQPNIIYGGPIHYKKAKESALLREKGLANTKVIVSGGERVGINEERENNKFYLGLGAHDEIYNGYGASELCGVFSVKKGSKNSEGSVGYPFPHNNVKICDFETGEEVPYGKDGDVFLSGEGMMLGYTNEEETRKAVHDGWFASGDIGHMNEDGELFITGRKKRQFVSGVDKVYIPIVEDVIESIPEVNKCVVVGVSDDELRKVPYAYIELKSELQGNGFEGFVEEKIKNIGKELLPETSIPKYFNYHSPIVYTGNGKVDFVMMEKNAENEISALANQKVNKK